jgi:hypothetical protein
MTAKRYKLKARAIGYSGVVGGGVTLDNEEGHACFVLSLIGTTKGVTKQETDEICARLVLLINSGGLIVTEREE